MFEMPKDARNRRIGVLGALERMSLAFCFSASMDAAAHCISPKDDALVGEVACIEVHSDGTGSVYI